MAVRTYLETKTQEGGLAGQRGLKDRHQNWACYMADHTYTRPACKAAGVLRQKIGVARVVWRGRFGPWLPASHSPMVQPAAAGVGGLLLAQRRRPSSQTLCRAAQVLQLGRAWLARWWGAQLRLFSWILSRISCKGRGPAGGQQPGGEPRHRGGMHRHEQALHPQGCRQAHGRARRQLLPGKGCCGGGGSRARTCTR